MDLHVTYRYPQSQELRRELNFRAQQFEPILRRATLHLVYQTKNVIKKIIVRHTVQFTLAKNKKSKRKKSAQNENDCSSF